MTRGPVMMPWMPHLIPWGSPLYAELWIGLWRALAVPWSGGLPPAGGRYSAGRSMTQAGESERAVGGSGTSCDAAPGFPT